MVKNICKLIEDLLPLYIEEDVSPESHQIIENHLKDCSHCQELLNQYVYYSQEIIDSLEETLPHTSTFKVWMIRLKKYAVAFIALVMVLVLTVGGASYYLGVQSNPNHQTIFYAKHFEDVEEYYYDRTPGFERAWEEGNNVKLLGETVEISESKGRITFDKIWYDYDKIYIFFHIEGEVPYNITGLLEWDDNLKTMSHMENLNIGEGMIYEDKFYSRLTFGNPKKREWDSSSLQTIEERIGISTILDYDKSYRMEGQIQVPEITFTIEFYPEMAETYIVDLEGTLLLDEHGEITLHQLLIEPQNSYLTFDYINQYDDRIQILAGTLTTDQGDERKLWIPVEPTGEASPFYKLKFDALDNIPAIITLEIEGIKLVTKEDLEFDMSVMDFHGELENPMKEEKVNRRLGSVRDKEIYLHRLYLGNEGLGISFLEKQEKHKNNALDRISSTSVYYEWMENLSSQYDDFKDWRFPNVIGLTNEKGIGPSSEDFGGSGQRSSTEGEYFSITIGKEYIESSERIFLRISNLTYKIYGPWLGEGTVHKNQI